jgi:hypothetical protein
VRNKIVRRNERTWEMHWKAKWLQKQTDETKGDAETTAQTIRELGGEALPFFGDISNFEVAGKMIQTTVDTFDGSLWVEIKK